MNFSRRQFVKGGVTAFTFGFAAPQMLCDIAFAQGVPSRNLVVVYLSGGNDSLSTVIPYRDPFYTSRRPTLAVPAGNVLQIGTDSSGVELGLHPRLTGLRSIFDGGRLAIVQRTGYANQSRSHFTGYRHLGHGQHYEHVGHRLAGTLPRSAAAADRSAGGLEHRARNAAAVDGAHGRRAGDHEPGDLRFLQPEHRRRGGVREDRADAHLVAPSRRSPAPRVRELDDAGGARNAGSRRNRRDLSTGQSRIRTTDSGRR